MLPPAVHGMVPMLVSETSGAYVVPAISVKIGTLPKRTAQGA